MNQNLFHALAREEFVEHYGELFEAVFVCGETCGFAKPEWPQAPVPYGLNLEANTFRAIQSAARQAGDERWIGTTTETLPPHAYSIVAEWRESALQRARTETVLGHFDGCLFGSSGRWGMLYFNDVDFGVFAAEPGVFSTFRDAAGGRARIWNRFLEFMTTEWCGSDERRQAVLEQYRWR